MLRNNRTNRQIDNTHPKLSKEESGRSTMKYPILYRKIKTKSGVTFLEGEEKINAIQIS